MNDFLRRLVEHTLGLGPRIQATLPRQRGSRDDSMSRLDNFWREALERERPAGVRVSPAEPPLLDDPDPDDDPPPRGPRGGPKTADEPTDRAEPGGAEPTSSPENEVSSAVPEADPKGSATAEASPAPREDEGHTPAEDPTEPTPIEPSATAGTPDAGPGALQTKKAPRPENTPDGPGSRVSETSAPIQTRTDRKEASETFEDPTEVEANTASNQRFPEPTGVRSKDSASGRPRADAPGSPSPSTEAGPAGVSDSSIEATPSPGEGIGSSKRPTNGSGPSRETVASSPHAGRKTVRPPENTKKQGSARDNVQTSGTEATTAEDGVREGSPHAVFPPPMDLPGSSRPAVQDRSGSPALDTADSVEELPQNSRPSTSRPRSDEPLEHASPSAGNRTGSAQKRGFVPDPTTKGPTRTGENQQPPRENASAETAAAERDDRTGKPTGPASDEPASTASRATHGTGNQSSAPGDRGPVPRRQDSPAESTRAQETRSDPSTGDRPSQTDQTRTTVSESRLSPEGTATGPDQSAQIAERDRPISDPSEQAGRAAPVDPSPPAQEGHRGTEPSLDRNAFSRTSPTGAPEETEARDSSATSPTGDRPSEPSRPMTEPPYPPDRARDAKASTRATPAASRERNDNPESEIAIPEEGGDEPSAAVPPRDREPGEDLSDAGSEASFSETPPTRAGRPDSPYLADSEKVVGTHEQQAAPGSRSRREGEKQPFEHGVAREHRAERDRPTASIHEEGKLVETPVSESAGVPDAVPNPTEKGRPRPAGSGFDDGTPGELIVSDSAGVTDGRPTPVGEDRSFSRGSHEEKGDSIDASDNLTDRPEQDALESATETGPSDRHTARPDGDRPIPPAEDRRGDLAPSERDRPPKTGSRPITDGDRFPDNTHHTSRDRPSEPAASSVGTETGTADTPLEGKEETPDYLRQASSVAKTGDRPPSANQAEAGTEKPEGEKTESTKAGPTSPRVTDQSTSGPGSQRVKPSREEPTTSKARNTENPSAEPIPRSEQAESQAGEALKEHVTSEARDRPRGDAVRDPPRQRETESGVGDFPESSTDRNITPDSPSSVDRTRENNSSENVRVTKTFDGKSPTPQTVREEQVTELNPSARGRTGDMAGQPHKTEVDRNLAPSEDAIASTLSQRDVADTTTPRTKPSDKRSLEIDATDQPVPTSTTKRATPHQPGEPRTSRREPVPENLTSPDAVASPPGQKIADHTPPPSRTDGDDATSPRSKQSHQRPAEVDSVGQPVPVPPAEETTPRQPTKPRASRREPVPENLAPPDTDIASGPGQKNADHTPSPSRTDDDNATSPRPEQSHQRPTEVDAAGQPVPTPPAEESTPLQPGEQRTSRREPVPENLTSPDVIASPPGQKAADDTPSPSRTDVADPSTPRPAQTHPHATNLDPVDQPQPAPRTEGDTPFHPGEQRASRREVPLSEHSKADGLGEAEATAPDPDRPPVQARGRSRSRDSMSPPPRQPIGDRPTTEDPQQVEGGVAEPQTQEPPRLGAPIEKGTSGERESESGPRETTLSDRTRPREKRRSPQIDPEKEVSPLDRNHPETASAASPEPSRSSSGTPLPRQVPHETSGEGAGPSRSQGDRPLDEVNAARIEPEKTRMPDVGSAEHARSNRASLEDTPSERTFSKPSSEGRNPTRPKRDRPLDNADAARIEREKQSSPDIAASLETNRVSDPEGPRERMLSEPGTEVWNPTQPKRDRPLAVTGGPGTEPEPTEAQSRPESDTTGSAEGNLTTIRDRPREQTHLRTGTEITNLANGDTPLEKSQAATGYQSPAPRTEPPAKATSRGVTAAHPSTEPREQDSASQSSEATTPSAQPVAADEKTGREVYPPPIPPRDQLPESGSEEAPHDGSPGNNRQPPQPDRDSVPTIQPEHPRTALDRERDRPRRATGQPQTQTRLPDQAPEDTAAPTLPRIEEARSPARASGEHDRERPTDPSDRPARSVPPDSGSEPGHMTTTSATTARADRYQTTPRDPATSREPTDWSPIAPNAETADPSRTSPASESRAEARDNDTAKRDRPSDMHPGHEGHDAARSASSIRNPFANRTFAPPLPPTRGSAPPANLEQSTSGATSRPPNVSKGPGVTSPAPIQMMPDPTAPAPPPATPTESSSPPPPHTEAPTSQTEDRQVGPPSPTQPEESIASGEQTSPEKGNGLPLARSDEQSTTMTSKDLAPPEAPRSNEARSAETEAPEVQDQQPIETRSDTESRSPSDEVTTHPPETAAEVPRRDNETAEPPPPSPTPESGSDTQAGVIPFPTMPPPPRQRGTARAPSGPPTLELSIGRIEVRAAKPRETLGPFRRPGLPEPRMNLDEYRKRKHGHE